jgi:hypothetical protein
VAKNDTSIGLQEKVLFKPKDKRLGPHSMSFSGKIGYVVSWMPFEGGKYLINFGTDSLWLNRKHLQRNP